jgi:hypothetical protein
MDCSRRAGRFDTLVYFFLCQSLIIANSCMPRTRMRERLEPQGPSVMSSWDRMLALCLHSAWRWRNRIDQKDGVWSCITACIFLLKESDNVSCESSNISPASGRCYSSHILFFSTENKYAVLNLLPSAMLNDFPFRCTSCREFILFSLKFKPGGRA